MSLGMGALYGMGYGGFGNNLTQRRNGPGGSQNFGGGIFGNGLNLGGLSLAGGLRGGGIMNRSGNNINFSNNITGLSRGFGQRSMLTPFAGNINDLNPLYNSLGLTRGLGLSRSNFSSLSTIRPLPSRGNLGLNQRLRDEVFMIPVLPLSAQDGFPIGREMELTTTLSHSIHEIVNDLRQGPRWVEEPLVQLSTGELVPLFQFSSGEDLYRNKAVCIVIYGE